MEDFKKWVKDNVIPIGSLLASGGIGFLIGRKGWKKERKHAAARETEAYFMGLKDGTIQTMSRILQDPQLTMDLGMREMEQMSKTDKRYKVEHF